MGNHERGVSPGAAEARHPFQLSREPLVEGKLDGLHACPRTPEPLDHENLGALPTTYGSRMLYLAARDPHCLFCYWDIDWTETPEAIRVDGQLLLKIYRADGAEVHSAAVDPAARNAYVQVAGGEAQFYAEIGFVRPGGEWETVARSNPAQTPAEGVAREEADQFATLPWHLAFQQMLDRVRAGMERGAALAPALARLQQAERPLLAALGEMPHWTPEGRRKLAALLGVNLAEWVEGDSAELDELLRRQLRERISSAFLGEKPSVFSDTGAFSPEKLLGSFASSWGAPLPKEAEADFWNQWVTSWAQAGKAGSS